MNNAEGLARRTKKVEVVQEMLFDIPPDWREHWWGMPAFEQGDARPYQRITVNFMCPEDVAEFSRLLGAKFSRKTDSMWFPPESVDRPNEWEYADES